MKRKAYKLVRKVDDRYITWVSEDMPEKYIVNYEIGKVAEPKIEDSPLFVFETIEMAYGYMAGNMSSIRLAEEYVLMVEYEEEDQVHFETRLMASGFFWSLDDNLLEDYWRVMSSKLSLSELKTNYNFSVTDIEPGFIMVKKLNVLENLGDYYSVRQIVMKNQSDRRLYDY